MKRYFEEESERKEKDSKDSQRTLKSFGIK